MRAGPVLGKGSKGWWWPWARPNKGPDPGVPLCLAWRETKRAPSAPYPIRRVKRQLQAIVLTGAHPLPALREKWAGHIGFSPQFLFREVFLGVFSLWFLLAWVLLGFPFPFLFSFYFSFFFQWVNSFRKSFLHVYEILKFSKIFKFVKLSIFYKISPNYENCSSHEVSSNSWFFKNYFFYSFVIFFLISWFSFKLQSF